MLTSRKWMLISIVWWLFALITIYAVPPHQGDALHYLSVAWHMFNTHIYLSTYSGEVLDLEKTPLFYWPIIAGWHIFGVSNAWPCIFTFFIGWINLILSWWLARQLFPDNLKISWLTVLILMTSLYWPTFYGDIRFEGLMTLFGLLFLNLLFKTLPQKNILYWVLASVAFGLCVFSKGPVAFIHFLPLAVLLPYWRGHVENLRQWYLTLLLVIFAGLVIPLLWVIAIYYQHGLDAVKYLIFGQITKRVGIQFSLEQFITLLKSFLPWSVIFGFFLVRGSWREFTHKKPLILTVFILAQVVFFCFGVKWQVPHYLIPIFPIVAILIASTLEPQLSVKQWVGIGCLFLIGLSIYELTWQRHTLQAASFAPAAQQIKIIENQHYAVAQFGTVLGYQNFGFLGRLPIEVPVVTKSEDKTEWLAKNPDGWIVTASKTLPNSQAHYQAWKINHQQFILLISAKDYLEQDNNIR